jgi:hypothetical protein
MQWGEENGDRKAILALAQGTGERMSDRQWDTELADIYQSTDKSVPEREWTIDKIALRNGRRLVGVPDATILEEIKTCSKVK